MNEIEEIQEKQRQTLEEAEKKKANFNELAKRRQLLFDQEFKAKVDSGLLDLKKYSAYLELRKKQAKIPELKKENNIIKAFNEYQEQIINSRKYQLSSAPWHYGRPTPDYCYISPSDEVTKASVDGNIIRMKVRAEATANWDSEHSKLILGNSMAYASVVFEYRIPSWWLPRLGGRIRIAPVMNMFGSFEIACNFLEPGDYAKLESTISIEAYQGEYGSAVKLGDTTVIDFPKPYPPPNVDNYSITTDQGPSFDFTYPLNPNLYQPKSSSYSYVGFKPSVEYDVIGNKNVIVVLKVQLSAKVSTSNSWFASSVQCDFKEWYWDPNTNYQNMFTGTGLNTPHIQIEELTIEIVKDNLADILKKGPIMLQEFK